MENALKKRAARIPLLAATFLLFSSANAPAWAAPTPEQQQQLDQCAIMSKAVFEFATTRDQGLSKPDAFKSVTHGHALYVPGSLLDQTEQWAYDHPDEQPESAAAHFYGRCAFDTFSLLTSDAETQLKSNVDGCQHDHDGKPDEIGPCINDKTAAIIEADSGRKHAAPATPPPSLASIGKITLGMPIDAASKTFGLSGETGTDEHGAVDYTYMISHDHGFIVLLTAPGKPDEVYGVEINGGADVDMAPIMGVRLGDGAFALLTHIGEPTSRQPIADDRSLWTYADRNYAFELSSGGDVVTIRIYGYTGVDTAAPSASSGNPAQD